MKFADIPGLLAEKEKLLSLQRQGRLPHALLLSGPEGSGKLALGLAFIQYLLCTAPSPSDSCGICPVCSKTSRLIHPDVHLSFPYPGLKENLSDEFLVPWREKVLNNPYLNANGWQEAIEKENKLFNIPVRECRNMLKKLSLTLFESNLRILLIWLPEYLGKEGNVLLKLIEEPPAATLILFVCENKELILPTILSRCQSLSIPAFAEEDIRSMLLKSGLKDESTLSTIILSAGGNMMEALKMSEDQTLPHVENMIKWLRLCYRGQGEELISWVDQFAGQGREYHRQFLKFGLKFIESVLGYKIRETIDEGYKPDEWKAIKGLANQLAVEEMQTISNLFDDHIYFVERNANPKILFASLSLNVKQLLNHEAVKSFDIM